MKAGLGGTKGISLRYRPFAGRDASAANILREGEGDSLPPGILSLEQAPNLKCVSRRCISTSCRQHNRTHMGRLSEMQETLANLWEELKVASNLQVEELSQGATDM